MDMGEMSSGLLVRNGSQIVVEVVRALPDLIHVSYQNGKKSFQGILLDSNRGSLPCGVYPQDKISSLVDEPAESHLYAVQQRFSYFTQEAKNITKKGHFSPLIAPKGMRTTCRLRPRQVLCSTCRAVCNEKKENVLAKSSRTIADKDFKKIAKPNFESKLPNFNDPDKRKSLDKIVEKCGMKRKSEIDMKVSLVPKLKKLKQSEINRCKLTSVTMGSSESLKNDNDNQTNKENRIDTSAKKYATVKKSKSVNLRKTRNSIGAAKPKFHSLDMKKRRDPIQLSESIATPLLEDSISHLGGNLKSSCGDLNSTPPSIPKLTISPHNINEAKHNELKYKSVPSNLEKTESLHTPTLKICINPDGIGRVLNGTVPTRRLCESADTVDYKTKVSSSSKAVKLAIGRVRKTHKRAFCLGGKSPRLNGMSPMRFASGMSPMHSRYMSPVKSTVCSPLRHAVLDSNLSASCANTDIPDEVCKKHKRKGKHKKKHKNDKKSKLSIDENHGKADEVDSLNSSHLNNNLTIRRKSKENDKPTTSENNSLPSKPKLSLSIKRLNSNGNQYVACENISPCDSESSGKSPTKSKITNKIRINLKEKECIVDSEGYPPVPIVKKKNASKDHSPDISLKLKVKEVKQCLMKACTDASEVLPQEMLEEWVFQIGDIVWAKNGGLHWLPGKIISLRVLEDCQAAGSSKESVPSKFVRGHKAKINWFDHSRDSSMVDPDSIKHFLRFFQVHYKKRKKKGPYRSSVKQALLEAKALQSLRKQVLRTSDDRMIDRDLTETMDVDNNTSENTLHESSWENSDELNGSNILTENYEPNLCSSRYSESPDYNIASSEDNSTDPLALDVSAVSDQQLRLGTVDPDLDVLPEFRTSRIDLNPPSTRLPSFMEEFYPPPDCTENVPVIEEAVAEIPESNETTQISPIYFSDANSDVNKFPLASTYSENSTDVNSNPGEPEVSPDAPQVSPVAPHYLESEGHQSTSTNREREVCFPSPIIQTANQIGFSSLLIKEEQNESCEQEDQGFPVNSMFQEMVDVELTGVTTSVMQTSLLHQQNDERLVNYIKEPNNESSHELIIKSACHIKTPS